MLSVHTKELLRESLIKTVQCPGMFVGTGRLDYLENFWAGWFFGAKDVYPWDCDREIQEWIFLKESVSLNSLSMHGRFLIPCFYGNEMEAIEQYEKLLKEVAFSSKEERKVSPISACLMGMSASFEEEYYNAFCACAPTKLREFAKKLVGKAEENYESLIPIINYMIGEPYDDLWVYLHLEGCVVCVKFLYYCQEKAWQENTVLLDKKEYFQCLLTLHARAAFVQEMEEKQEGQIITLRHYQGHITVKRKKTHNKWDDISCYYENKPICESYKEWKTDIKTKPSKEGITPPIATEK